MMFAVQRAQFAGASLVRPTRGGLGRHGPSDPIGDAIPDKADYYFGNLDEDRFFACADFSEGSNWFTQLFSTTVDLDFYVRKTDKGWDVNEVLIHKVKGKPRFTYDKNNNRVPVEG